MSLNNNQAARAELNIDKNQRVAICRCWQSKKFPYCDGSHRDYNLKYNDNLGPLIICCNTAENTNQ